jgi:hypothetical protein
LDEDDSKPLHLCPVCWRKLHFNIGFDIVAREKNLFAFFKKYKFKQEAEWVKHRLHYITGTLIDSSDSEEDDDENKGDQSDNSLVQMIGSLTLS